MDNLPAQFKYTTFIFCHFNEALWKFAFFFGFTLTSLVLLVVSQSQSQKDKSGIMDNYLDLELWI